MDTRNNNRPFSSQSSSQRLYEDDHNEISRICRESGRKPAEEIRDLVSEALSARRNPQADLNEILQTLQQLVEQNRLANERYERLLEKYEQLDERNARLKQGLIQNLREFYGILLETLSAAIGARRVAWNFVAHTVLKQSGFSDEQINERYRAEKKAWIEEKDRIAKLLEEGISKMPPQQ
jgi:type I site-specific restriction-modification system R (restriction) subunit